MDHGHTLIYHYSTETRGYYKCPKYPQDQRSYNLFDDSTSTEYWLITKLDCTFCDATELKFPREEFKDIPFPVYQLEKYRANRFDQSLEKLGKQIDVSLEKRMNKMTSDVMEMIAAFHEDYPHA